MAYSDCSTESNTLSDKTVFHSKGRFKTAIRLAYSDFCWAKGREPFGQVPGNDPEFHKMVDTVAEHLLAEMYEMLNEAVFDN